MESDEFPEITDVTVFGIYVDEKVSLCYILQVNEAPHFINVIEKWKHLKNYQAQYDREIVTVRAPQAQCMWMLSKLNKNKLKGCVIQSLRNEFVGGVLKVLVIVPRYVTITQ